MTKEALLTKTNPKTIFAHYLGTKKLTKRKYVSPITNEKDASLQFYPDTLTFKCFSSGCQGDCFQLVADIESFNIKTQFHKVLEKINNDLNLGLSNSETKSKLVKVEHKPLSKAHLDFWEKLNVSESLLKSSKTHAVKAIHYTNKDGEQKKFEIFTGVLAFDYVVNGRHEVYIPDQPKKNVKKQFYKNQQKSDIFGIDLLPVHTDYIIIAAGKKDTLVSISYGFPAVCFNSESTFPEPAQIRALKDKCKNLLVCYDIDPNGAGQKNAKRICQKYNLPNIVLPASGESSTDIAVYLPMHGAEAFRQLVNASLATVKEKTYSKVFVQDGHYYITKQAKKESYDFELTNFTMKVIALINSETNPRRIVQIKTPYHTSDPFEFPVEAFISVNKFRKALESVDNYFFYGTEEDLMELKKLVFNDSDITREIIDLGYDSKSGGYVLSNGVIYDKYFIEPDKFGIAYVSGNQGLYIPSASILAENQTRFRESKKFKYAKSSVTLQAWFDQFYEVYGERSIIALSFVMAAVNFDHVANEINTFPILNMFGPKGSGKSSMALSLSYIFGSPQEALMLPNATQAAISSRLAHIKNGVTWFDEFKNSLPDWVDQTLKGVFDLQGRTRKSFSNDNATYSSLINSPLILTGQEVPFNAALLSRCISFPFKPREFSALKKQLKNDLEVMERKGLGSVLLALVSMRSAFVRGFRSNFNEIIDSLNDKLKEMQVYNVEPRLLDSFSTLLSSLSLYMDNGFNLTLPVSNEEIIDIFIKQIILQKELEAENDEVVVFWNTVESLVGSGKLKENIDFRIDKSKDTLSFKSTLFDQYAQHMFRTTGERGLHKSSLQNYLKGEKYYITNKTTVKFNINEYSTEKKASNAYQVVYSLLPVQLHKESISIDEKDENGMPFSNDTEPKQLALNKN